MFIWVYLTFFFFSQTQKINYSVPPQAGFQAISNNTVTHLCINYEKACGVAGLVQPPKRKLL